MGKSVPGETCSIRPRAVSQQPFLRYGEVPGSRVWTCAGIMQAQGRLRVEGVDHQVCCADVTETKFALHALVRFDVVVEVNVLWYACSFVGGADGLPVM